MLLHRQQQHPQSTREQTLSTYSNHLQQLSAHLDARAGALQSSEARLAASQSDLSQHRHALTQLETRARHQIAQLLRHIHQRQSALVAWEHTAASAKKALSKNLSAIDALFSEATSVAAHLNRIRNENDRLQDAVNNRRAQLAEIQTQVKAANKSYADLKNTVETIIKDKKTIQRAADRLQSLDANLRSRETSLNAREQTVNHQTARLQRLQPLEVLSIPLQAFLDNAAAASLIDRVSVDNDIGVAVDVAVLAMRELRKESQELQASRANINEKWQQLSTHEVRLKDEDSDLRKKRQSLDREKAALERRSLELSATQAEVREAWRAIEEARRQADARDELLRVREEAVEHAESRIQQRKTVLSERENTLARRERSIRRAHAAVAARESAVQTRERDIKKERARLTDLSKAIELKESMLETRDLELSAREADQGRIQEAMLQRSLEISSSVKRPRSETNIDQESGALRSRHGKTDKCLSPKDSAGRETAYANAAPSTVRRHLALFDSSKDVVGNEDARLTADKEDEQNMADDDSEAAAEQLLPELIGARSYWHERVERLERIVQGIRDKTWAVKPHVLPVLTSVAEGLSAIRREINEFPEPASNGSPKNAYLNEQAYQIRWREQMRQHFDSVREVQAGLLIQLNREEDAVGHTEELNDHEGEQSAGTSKTAESSVDATLDVTLTDLTRDTLEVRKEERKRASPVRQHSLTRRSVGGLRRSPMTEFSSTLWSDAFNQIDKVRGPQSSSTTVEGNSLDDRSKPEREQHENVSPQKERAGILERITDVIPEEPIVLGENVLQELALLRHDLDNVTVSQDTEPSFHEKRH